MQTLYPWLRRSLPLTFLVLLLGGVWWYQRPDGRLHIFFLPTSGDAALIQTPGGSFILIDGGSDPATLTNLMSQRIPFWQHRLAAVVLTAPRSGWLPGQVAALARYRADIAFAPSLRSTNPLVAEWRRLLADGETRIRVAQTNSRLEIDGVALTAIDPGDGVNSGLIVRLDYGRVRILFDNAAGDDEESRLSKLDGRVHAIVFPWSRPLPEKAFARLRPRILVFTDALSVDHPVELSTLDRAVGGAAVYHEKLHGEIELVSDGAQIMVH